MVVGHAREDVVEHHDGVVDVGALVQHDALGALPHRGVADLGPGRQTALGHLLEDLGRPDHRQMGGLTQPQRLLLHLGQSLVADLDGQVAARDHDSDPGTAHRGQEQLRKSLEGTARLDLQDDTDPVAAEPAQLVVQPDHVGRVLDERHLDHVGDLGDGTQIVDVLVGQRRHRQRGVGQVDALGGAQFRALRGRPPDSHFHRVGIDSDDVAADPAVVEEHLLPDPGVTEHRSERAPDARGARRLGRDRRAVPGEPQGVTRTQHQALLVLRQRTDFGGIVGAVDAQHRSAGHIGGLVGADDDAAGAALRRQQGALGPAGVVEREDIRVRPAREPLRGHRQCHHSGLGRRGRGRLGRQPGAGGRHDVAEVVAVGPQFDHAGSGLNRAGAQLRTREVHGDQAAA